MVFIGYCGVHWTLVFNGHCGVRCVVYILSFPFVRDPMKVPSLHIIYSLLKDHHRISRLQVSFVIMSCIVTICCLLSISTVVVVRKMRLRE